MKLLLWETLIKPTVLYINKLYGKNSPQIFSIRYQTWHLLEMEGLQWLGVKINKLLDKQYSICSFS